MNTALILIGGIGNRFDSQSPKQFFLYKNIPLFIYTIKKFNEHKDIDNIVLVSHKDYLNEVTSLVKKYNLDKVSKIVSGGITRMESSFLGLKEINDEDLVLIHDGCRPLVSEEIISNNIKAMESVDAVVTALKASDTVSYSVGQEVDKVLDRNTIYLHQTPQTFKAKLIKDAFNKIDNKNDFTDEATLLTTLGYKVKIIEGNKDNIKITTKEDLIFLVKLL